MYSVEENPTKGAAPMPGKEQQQGAATASFHEGVPVGEQPASPVEGVPLYSEDLLGDEETKKGVRRFKLRGYKDIWAAVIFLLALLFTIVMGCINFKSDTRRIEEEAAAFNHAASGSHQAGTQYPDGSSVAGGKTVSSDTRNVDIQFGKVMVIAVGVTLAAGVGAALALGLLSKAPRQAIIGCNVALAAMYALASIAAFVGGSIWSGVVSLVFALLQLLWLYLVCDRIPFAALLLKISCHVVMRYKATILGSFAAVAAFYIYMIFYASMMLPVALNLLDDERNHHESSGGDGALFVLYLLLFYWTSQVILNVLHVTVAGLVATWYFCGDSHMPPNPTKASLKRACTTSFGSICFGSLLVAILKTLRKLVEMHRGDSNEFVNCVAHCILSILERLMEWFNTYAFVHIAIYGCGYVEGSKRTWNLAKTHFWRAAFNDCLIEPTITLTALGMGIFMGIIVGLLTNVAIGILCALLTFAVASIVLRCLESAVPTIFVCYAECPEALLNCCVELYNMLHAADAGTVPPTRGNRNGNNNTAAATSPSYVL